MNTLNPRALARHESGRARLSMAVVGALALAIPIVLLPDPVSAHLDTVFEIEDGNPQDPVEAVAPDDWETLFNGGGSALATTDVPVFDGADAPTDISYWKGGGSKDVNPISRWAYSGTDVAPDKNEIVNAAAAAYVVPDGDDDGDDDDLVLMFHSDRFSNDGDSAMGFWFLKAQVELDGNGGFTGAHTDGDVLVVSDFNEGENVNTVRIFQWEGSAEGGALVEKPVPGGAVFDCSAGGHNVNACATQNAGDVTAVWDYTPKANVGVDGTYPAYTFLEGAVNINGVFGDDADRCFASFLAETRSSTSPTAQLKDFVIGRFPICEPATTLTASSATANGAAGTHDGETIVVAGDSVGLTFNEKNTGNINLTDVYVDTDSTDCDTTISPTQSAGTSLAPDASQDFTCTVDTDATDTDGEIIDVVGIGHGTDPIDRDVTYCSDPENPPADTICDANERDTIRVVSIQPSTSLSASVDSATVKEGDLVTFTVTETNDGKAPATEYERYLALGSVDVFASATVGGSSDPTLAAACRTGDASATPARPGLDDGPTSKSGGDDDALLEKGETWTYKCAVVAPSSSFNLTFNGYGEVLDGDANYEQSIGPSALSPDIVDSDETDDVDVTVIAPSTELTITASASITYTFNEKNDGDSPITPPTPGDRTSVLTADSATGISLCDSAISYSSGDGDGSGDDTVNVLDPGETWVFTCTATLDGPRDSGTNAYLDNGTSSTGEVGATASGTDGSSAGDTVTWCQDSGSPPTGTLCDQDERDTVTVTITHHTRGGAGDLYTP